MSRLRRVVNNTVISLAGQLVTWASTFLLMAAYGRFLGDVKFGELYFATSFVLLIGIPIERGFDQQVTREVAQRPDQALRYLSNTVLIKTVLWVVLFALLLFLCRLLGYSEEVYRLVMICGVSLLSTSIATTFGSVHYAFERVLHPVIGTILEKGLTALVGILLLRNGATVQTMAFVLLGGSLVSMLWQAFWCFKAVGFGFALDRAVLRALLRTSIPFIVYGMVGVLYYRLDTVMLSLMTNDAVVGWYGAGYRLFDTLTFLPNLIISAIMYPVFSKLSMQDEGALKTAIEKTMNFLLFCGLPIATLMILSAPNILGFLYHRTEFDHTIPVLQALAPGLVFLYLNSIFSAIVVSLKQEKKIMVQAAIALVFNCLGNVVCIQLFQHVGSAAITSCTEMLLCGLYFFFSVPRHLLPRRSAMVLLKTLVACVALAAVAFLLQRFHIFVILPAAMVVYLAFAFLLGSIPREDLLALYQAVRYKAQRKNASVSLNGGQEEPVKLS
ncbi:O-antigen/teichoic acid export membrane protein [Thermosporothrix hazakensis]|uniref:O-antigen/teichoic acid export membrane protein n=1 Tax=Thermosporothrix hazakensis TaxID=644383 RepID=A0A326UBH6_THEHA|nr:flippase [Thermosporothrix hazakensis]PZW35952.1 O-antigen/teichoic acid export membrane protein [Thermosporothrix hazakensis]